MLNWHTVQSNQFSQLQAIIKMLFCPIVNSAAMNIRVHVSFSIKVFSGYMPCSGMLGHMVVLFQVF